MYKTYLGDSVYAEFENSMVKLTTENGGQSTEPSNIIYLEAFVFVALNEWMKQTTLRLSDESIDPEPKLKKENPFIKRVK